MSIFKTVNGQAVKMSAKEIKSYTLKVRGWTSEQYKKYYDILKNKTRSYEAFAREAGFEIETISVAELIYYESKGIERVGSKYTTPKLKLIKSFQSISSGKTLKSKLKDEKFKSKIYKNQLKSLIDKFGYLASSNDTIYKLVYETLYDFDGNEINPFLREKMILDFLVKYKKPTKKKKQANAIPVEDFSDGSYEELSDAEFSDFLTTYGAYI